MTTIGPENSSGQVRRGEGVGTPSNIGSTQEVKETAAGEALLNGIVAQLSPSITKSVSESAIPFAKLNA